MNGGNKVSSTEKHNSKYPESQQLPILIGGRPTVEELLREVPRGLDEWGVGVWNETVPLLAESGLIDRIDRGLLEHYCRQAGRAREVADYLQWEEVPDEPGKRRPRPVGRRLLATTARGDWTSNPLLSQERAAGQEARLAGELLGLNPVGRARLKMGAGKKPQGSGLKSLTSGLPDGQVVDIKSRKRA